MLVEDVGVRIIAGRVEAEQHLPARAAMDVDQCRMPSRSAGPEELAVDLDSVFGPEDHRFGGHEALGGRCRLQRLKAAADEGGMSGARDVGGDRRQSGSAEHRGGFDAGAARDLLGGAA
jgi:hypothetical protein